MTHSGISNWPTPARLTVGIVSAGRVGTAFGCALESVGHVVGAVVARSQVSRDRASAQLPESEMCDVAGVARRSDLIVLAVPDAQLPEVVDELATVVRPGTIVVHTAGGLGVRILEPLVDVMPIAIHPVMTFVDDPRDVERMRAACFGITAADEIAYAIGSTLVLEMGGQPIRIAESSRTLYHAAIAHGANHVVVLIADALEGLRMALAGVHQIDDDVPGGQASPDPTLPARILAPIATAALENSLERGALALTGPVARGDADAVDAHVQALIAADPQLAAAYRAMSLRAAAYADAPASVWNVLRGSA